MVLVQTKMKLRTYLTIKDEFLIRKKKLLSLQAENTRGKIILPNCETAISGKGVKLAGQLLYGLLDIFFQSPKFCTFPQLLICDDNIFYFDVGNKLSNSNPTNANKTDCANCSVKPTFIDRIKKTKSTAFFCQTEGKFFVMCNLEALFC